MDLQKRIDLIDRLGQDLKRGDDFLDAIFHRTSYHNQWFTIENQKTALKAVLEEFFAKEKLEKWVANYPEINLPKSKVVGLIMAGNIPFVGIQDLICVFIAGHKSKIKLSEKDPYVLPYLVKKLIQLEPEAEKYFEIVEFLKDFDAAIATGSNNTGRYFESYFKKYPNIIRKNRNSVGVLTGEETDAELLALGLDIFQYFGLGCRNVSKIFVPENYDFQRFLEILHEYKSIILHNKYKNNFDYNFALMTLNRAPFLFNGSLILVENKSLNSRIATLHYEKYETLQQVENDLIDHQNEIQCVLAGTGVLTSLKTIPFGASQSPTLFDYADNVDVMKFLIFLK